MNKGEKYIQNFMKQTKQTRKKIFLWLLLMLEYNLFAGLWVICGYKSIVLQSFFLISEIKEISYFLSALKLL